MVNRLGATTWRQTRQNRLGSTEQETTAVLEKMASDVDKQQQD